MNTYAVKTYFEAYPKLKECFETAVDGVLHPSKGVAEKWVEKNANKKIIAHANPAMKEEVKEEAKEMPPVPVMIDHEVTEDDLINNPELVDQGVRVGDVIQIPEQSQQ